jgi:glucose/arabinose dehydrogenase
MPLEGNVVKHSVRLIFLSLLLLSLSACFKSEPPVTLPTNPPAGAVDSKTERLSEAGGTLTLSDGSYVTIPQGFLDTSADVRFYSSTQAPSINKSGYEPGKWHAIGYTYTLELPQAAVKLTPENEAVELSFFVPAFKEHQTAENAVAEIIFESGEQILMTQGYSPTGLKEDEYAQGPLATNLFKINNRQLRGGIKEADTIKVIIRPVVEAPQLSAQAIPTGFVLEDVVTGLNLGVAFDFAKDGRIFIAEKAGKVRVVQNDALLPTPFIDISAQVNSIADRGLLGLAVHPDFPEQPYLYLLFTHDPPEAANYPNGTSPGTFDGSGARVSRLIRVTADANQGYNVAVPGSELVLLGKNSTFANVADMAVRNGAQSCYKNNAYVQDCLPADEMSHTIGTVRFGTDGALYVGNGDGANYTRVEAYASRALDINSLAGKILKINPETGEGYATNPFYNGGLNSNASKVYSLGLRNPFRFTINQTTNEPWVGDVGWGTWEEVNTGRGANFGWPCYEGGNKTNEKSGGYQAIDVCQAFYNNLPTNLTSSAYGYYRAGVGSSVQVGDFYTGTAYPAEFRGALFITDFNQQWIKYLTFNPDGTVKAVNNFATSEAGVVQTSAGPDTNLYLMRIYDGKLQRLRYTAAGNNAPVAGAEATPPSGEVPLTVAFNSFASFDADAQDLSYLWNFGKGATSTEAHPTYTYSVRGVYTVTLKVTDPLGASNTTQISVRAGSNPPVATITSPADGTQYSIGDVISFSGTGSDTEDGTLTGSSLRWDMRLHHNEHVHFDELPNTFGTSGNYLVTDHGDNTYLELCLIATDSSGQSNRTCVNLYPRTLQVTLNSVPSGLQLGWDGTSQPTPFTVTTIAGSRHSLTALDTQNGLSFKNWSDGGARVHDVTLGTTATTFSATYSANSATCAGLVQEAETGALFGDFTVGNDSVASGGKFVYIPEGPRFPGWLQTPNQNQRVDYCFNVATSGTYRIKASAYASTGEMDTFFVKVDSQPTSGYIWYVPRNTTYRSSYVTDRAGTTPVSVNLTAGVHAVSFYLREAGTRLDKIALEQVSGGTAGKLESVIVNNVSSSAWTSVTLQNTYQRMVAVCTIKMQNNTLPEVVRVQNATGNSFQIRLQNPSGSALVGEQVMCLVAEAGSWRLPDGRAFEGQQVVSIKEDRPYYWYGDRVSYNNSYTNPVVLGQVMTYNDARWSTFWSHGPGPDPRREPANSSIFVGKSIGEDPALDRADEMLGFMVFEAGSGIVAGVPYSINLGTQTVWGYSNNPRGGDYTFAPAFAATPKIAVVSQAGMDGGDGSWALLRGASPFSATTLNLLVDEDQLKDSERWAIEHQVGYAVFGNDINLTLTTPSASAASLGTLSSASMMSAVAIAPRPTLSLDAVLLDGYTTIFWASLDNSVVTGFTVLRSASADSATAQALSPFISVTEANEYSFVDHTATSSQRYYYWLEVSKLGGSKEVIGPETR